MLRSHVLFLTLLGIAAHAQRPASPPGAGATPPAPRTALITGRVVNAGDGMPIPAAIVSITVTGQRSPFSPVLSDADGRYFFAELPAGMFTIEASKPGYLTGTYGRERPTGSAVPVTLTDGQRQGDVDVALSKPGVLTGRVLDSASDPMVGADVRAFPMTYIGGRLQPGAPQRALTDDRGIYRFSSLIPGAYLVCVPATVTSEPTGFVSIGSSDMPAAYRPTMTDIGAAPMMLDRSTIATANPQWGISSVLHVPSSPDEDSVWRTYPTTYAPSSLTRSGATIYQVASGLERSGADVIVALQPTYTIAGVVKDPDGPAANHAVHLLGADVADAPLVDTATAITNAAGQFLFYGVPKGDYVARVVRLPALAVGEFLIFGGTGAVSQIGISGSSTAFPRMSDAPLWHATVPVAVEDGPVRNLTLQLEPGFRVSGRVVFDGKTSPSPEALARSGVVLMAAALRPPRASVPSAPLGANGEFATPSTWPGRYLLRGQNMPAGWTLKSAIWNGTDISETAFDLSHDLADVVMTFTDQAHTISGSVMRDVARATAPVAVLLFPTNRAAWLDYGQGSRRVRATGATPAGAYSMPAPPPGDYFLVAIPDADSNEWQNPAILARLATIAATVVVRAEQSPVVALKVQRVPRPEGR